MEPVDEGGAYSGTGESIVRAIGHEGEECV